MLKVVDMRLLQSSSGITNPRFLFHLVWLAIYKDMIDKNILKKFPIHFSTRQKLPTILEDLKV